MNEIEFSQLCPSQLHLPNIKWQTAEYYFPSNWIIVDKQHKMRRLTI